MVGRVGLEPTRFRVSGLQPPAVATVPPADEQATFNNLGLEPKPSVYKTDALPIELVSLCRKYILL